MLGSAALTAFFRAARCARNCVAVKPAAETSLSPRKGSGDVSPALVALRRLVVRVAGSRLAAFAAVELSTVLNLACTTGTKTICAMRSPGSMVKCFWPRFQTDTISWP